MLDRAMFFVRLVAIAVCIKLKASLAQRAAPLLFDDWRHSSFYYKNRFFESPPKVGFQKTNFGVYSAFGTGNTKIGFIIRIAAGDSYITLSLTNRAMIELMC
ncbi:MAG: hypothetical protein ACK59J_00930 [Pseudanabaena sp.]